MVLASDYITDKFILKWEPRYDESESDEPEYKSLVKKVAADVAELGTLRRDTFVRILMWKWEGLKGNIVNDKHQIYLDTIGACVLAEGLDKLKVLVDLPFIAVPVASTFVHFLQPTRFPIMDRRTVGVLHHFNVLKYKSRDLKRYPAFMDAIHEIQQRHVRWSLREIDRALFAFHKATFDTLKGSGKGRSC